MNKSFDPTTPATLPPDVCTEFPIPSKPREIVADEIPDEVRAAEMEMMSYMFYDASIRWQAVTDIDSAVKMGLYTMRLMEKRRDVLGLPNGYRPERQSKGMLVYPID